MRCPLENKDNTGILLDYCARKLSPEMTIVFENHMESCADCRSFSEAQRSAWEALDAWEPAPISEDFDKILYRRIEQHENSGWFTKLWHRTVWQPAFSGSTLSIGTACVTAIVAVMLYLPMNKPAVDLQAPQVKIESSDLEQLENTLEDIEMFKQLTPESSSRS